MPACCSRGFSVNLINVNLARAVSRIQSFSLLGLSSRWVSISSPGRHREAYARVAETVRSNPTDDAPLPQALLPEIAFNPLTWEFQALLFALLGMILCAVGFAKGFTFIRSAGFRHDTDADIEAAPETSGQDDSVRTAQDKMPRHVVTAYEDVLNQFRAGIGRLRDDVADWHASLDQKRRDMHGTVNVLKEEKNRQACIECVTHAFISEYNNRHAEKIDLATVEAHREQRYREPILVTPSDAVVLEEAATLAIDWKKSGQANLERRITDAQEEMIALWARYEPLVLAPEQGRKSITYGFGTSPIDTPPVRQGNQSRNEKAAAGEG